MTCVASRAFRLHHFTLFFIYLFISSVSLFHLQRVEQQEREDAEAHVKPKGGRSQQQRKKTVKPAKKQDDKPKAQAKKPTAQTENKKTNQNKGGKAKEAAAKKTEKSGDVFELDEEETAPAPLSLADRIAQKRKMVLLSSSSSASSGTESAVSGVTAKAKKQSTLDMFGAKKSVGKRAKKDDSDDDFIMEFSDEDGEEVPSVKRTAPATVTLKDVSVLV